MWGSFAYFAALNTARWRAIGSADTHFYRPLLAAANTRAFVVVRSACIHENPRHWCKSELWCLRAVATFCETSQASKRRKSPWHINSQLVFRPFSVSAVAVCKSLLVLTLRAYFWDDSGCDATLKVAVILRWL